MKFAWPTRALVCTAIMLSSLGLASPAHADTLTFNMSFPYTGETPASTLPVATAVFASNFTTPDCGAQCGAGQVRLTLTTSLENASEFLTDWNFNSTNTNITVAFQAALSSAGFAAPTTAVSPDGFNAGGGGGYDINIEFASGPPASRFNGVGEIAVFLITPTTGTINAASFDTLAAPGGNGPFKAITHVQGIPPDCSGWVANQAGTSGTVPCGTTVPEPSSLILLGSGLTGLALLWRRRSGRK